MLFDAAEMLRGHAQGVACVSAVRKFVPALIRQLQLGGKVLKGMHVAAHVCLSQAAHCVRLSMCIRCLTCVRAVRTRHFQGSAWSGQISTALTIGARAESATCGCSGLSVWPACSTGHAVRLHLL